MKSVKLDSGDNTNFPRGGGKAATDAKEPKNKIATRLEICDIFGRVVTSENLDYQTSILERKNISDGIYLFKFFNKSKLISTNKIIFK